MLLADKILKEVGKDLAGDYIKVRQVANFEEDKLNK